MFPAMAYELVKAGLDERRRRSLERYRLLARGRNHSDPEDEAEIIQLVIPPEGGCPQTMGA